MAMGRVSPWDGGAAPSSCLSSQPGRHSPGPVQPRRGPWNGLGTRAPGSSASGLRSGQHRSSTEAAGREAGPPSASCRRANPSTDLLGQLLPFRPLRTQPAQATGAAGVASRGCRVRKGVAEEKLLPRPAPWPHASSSSGSGGPGLGPVGARPLTTWQSSRSSPGATCGG